MKRLFPWATTEAPGLPGLLGLLGLLGLAAFANLGCAPDHSVQPGAPVLTKLTIIENGTNATDITASTAACPADAKSGGMCDPSVSICKAAAAVWCRCAAGMDPTMGAYDCDPFSPMSVVVATFDRILDTAPLDPGDASFRTDIASLTATPTPPMPITADADYASQGTASGLVFNAFGPFFGNLRSSGPSIAVVGSPALETGATIEMTLQKMSILAKDGKTQFTGTGFLADGSLSFQTAAFSATIGVPTQPPPDASADAATESDADAGASDAGASDAGEAGAAEAGVAEAGASEAGASDGGVLDGAIDASIDAVASEVGLGDAADEIFPTDASVETIAEAGTAPPPEPGLPVTADMNMIPVTIAFNNTVDPVDVQKHITITEDGVDFLAKLTVDTTKAPTLKFTPMTAWAPGKTYVVTVDADAADVLGDKLGTAVAAAFMMAE
jgi:Bacterial Ig-like domain